MNFNEDGTTYLYIIADPSVRLYKVGESVNPFRRLREIQIKIDDLWKLTLRKPPKLTLITFTPGTDRGLTEIESSRVNYPASDATFGGKTEWYKPTPEVHDFIKSTMQKDRDYLSQNPGVIRWVKSKKELKKEKRDLEKMEAHRKRMAILQKALDDRTEYKKTERYKNYRLRYDKYIGSRYP